MTARRPRHLGPIIALLLTAAIALPTGALGIILFTDVTAENPFFNDIQALAGSGVTTGCGDGKFCPKDVVTREQMAAFMNRLGALAADKTPVVNADKLDGKHATDFQLYTLKTSHFGAWNMNAGGAAGVTVERWVNETIFKTTAAGSDKWPQLDVPTPITFGTTTYGFKSAEVCWDASSGVTLAAIYVRDSGKAGLAATIVQDMTSRSMATAGCATVTDPAAAATDGGVNIMLSLTFANAASARITSTQVTWARVLTLAPAAVDKAQDGPGMAR